MDTKKYTVSIAGITYSLRTDEQENDVIQAAQIVNQLIEEMGQKSQTVIDKDKAILIALYIAVNQVKLKDQLDTAISHIASLISKISSELS